MVGCTISSPADGTYLCKAEDGSYEFTKDKESIHCFEDHRVMLVIAHSLIVNMAELSFGVK